MLKKLVTIAALLAGATSAQAVALVPQAVDWNTDGHSGSLGNTTVALSTVPGWGSVAPTWYGGSAGFEQPMFTGPISTGEAISIFVLPNGFGEYVIDFSHPVLDVHVSLLSFGSLVYIGNERGQLAQRVSGDSRFFHACSSTSPCLYGQQFNGVSPNDGNGTAVISGLSSRVWLDFRSQTTANGDEIHMQISGLSTAPLAAVPEPAGAALLLMGLAGLLSHRRVKL